MARPKRTTLPAKTRQINMRLNEKQYELLASYAAQLNMPLTTYIREAILNGPPTIKCNIAVDMPELQLIARDLHGACNNLNQIAKQLNSGSTYSDDTVLQINKCIAAIFEIRDLLSELKGGFYGDH